MSETLSDRALCSDSDVLALLKVDAPSAQETDLAVRLANAASDAIANLTDREFKPAVDEARDFDAEELVIDPSQPVSYGRPTGRPYGYPAAELPIGDADAVDSVTVTFWDGSSDVLASSEWTALPRRRKAWEPLTAVRLEPAGTNVANIRSVEVSASWGFPSVPEDVRQAAILTAASWYGRDVARFSDTFVQADQAAASPGSSSRAIPSDAYDLLLPFIRRGVG